MRLNPKKTKSVGVSRSRTYGPGCTSSKNAKEMQANNGGGGIQGVERRCRLCGVTIVSAVL